MSLSISNCASLLSSVTAFVPNIFLTFFRNIYSRLTSSRLLWRPSYFLTNKSHQSSSAEALINNNSDIAVQYIKKYFPGSVCSQTIKDCISVVLEKRGFTDDNTLYAQSVCPDEINHQPGDVTNLLTEYFGEVFHFGGLAGIPFTGKTGFAAYANHVPENGHCFILMAPHIGISESNKLGMYTRLGQCGHEGTACGAAVGAYNFVCTHTQDELPSLETTVDDYQMTYIIHELNKRKENIQNKTINTDENNNNDNNDDTNHNNLLQAEIANQTHDIAKTLLDEVISTNFGSENSKLVILTGIQINMPHPLRCYFQPISFRMFHKNNGGSIENLMKETFGHDNTTNNNGKYSSSNSSNRVEEFSVEEKKDD